MPLSGIYNSKVVSWHPSDPDVFALAQSNASVSGRLEIYGTKVNSHDDGCGDSSFQLRSSTPVNSSISCLEWNPTSKSLLAYGGASGTVNLTSEQQLSQDPSKTYSLTADMIGKRSCNAISWNRQIPTQIAAGFDNTRR